ncbi:MAG: FecR family protein [Candidatus Riflebacteria bacterium]|nr:FecR family protein [Candidatus Riflebacteria bacterium]
MNCSAVKDLFSQHADSDSDLTKNSDFVRHISECAQCRSDFESHIKLVKALKKGFSDFTPWPDQQFNFKFPVQQNKKESIVDVISRFITMSWKPLTTAAFACIILFLFYFGSHNTPVCDFYLKTGRLVDIAAQSQAHDGKLSSRSFLAEVESQICCSLSDSSSYFQSRVSQDSLFSIKQNEIALEDGMLWIIHRDIPVKIAIPGAKISIIGTEFLVVTHGDSSLIRIFEGKVELIDSKKITEIKSGENYIYELASGTFVDMNESLQATWDRVIKSPAKALKALHPAAGHQVPVQNQQTDKSPDSQTNSSLEKPPKTFAPASETLNKDKEPESTLENSQELINPVEGLGN